MELGDIQIAIAVIVVTAQHRRWGVKCAELVELGRKGELEAVRTEDERRMQILRSLCFISRISSTVTTQASLVRLVRLCKTLRMLMASAY